MTGDMTPAQIDAEIATMRVDADKIMWDNTSKLIRYRLLDALRDVIGPSIVEQGGDELLHVAEHEVRAVLQPMTTATLKGALDSAQRGVDDAHRHATRRVDLPIIANTAARDQVRSVWDSLHAAGLADERPRGDDERPRGDDET